MDDPDEPHETAVVARRSVEKTEAEVQVWTTARERQPTKISEPLVRPPPPLDPGPARPTPDQRKLVTEVVRVRKSPRSTQRGAVPVDDLVLTDDGEE